MVIPNSKRFVKYLRKKPYNCYIIHYSCQSLYDDNEGLSPRITSIAISHVETEQTVSFSTHSVAEELGISREEVRDRFDEVEKNLLEQFYVFVRDRRDRLWIHWNMRNLTYGFEHLEHRFRVLGGVNPPIIPVEQRINLNDILSDRYGSNYANHPKLKSLMEMNGGIHRYFLTGQEEVDAFQSNEFIRMHNSTLCKVGFFQLVAKKLVRGRLHTSSRGWGVALDRIFESRVAKSIGLFATLLTIGLGLWQIWPPLAAAIAAMSGGNG